MLHVRLLHVRLLRGDLLLLSADETRKKDRRAFKARRSFLKIKT